MFYRLRAGAAVLLGAALLLGGCGDNGDKEDDAGVRVLPQPTTGPYVSVAVDYHFHDIHPEDHIEIASDRPFVVKNQGRNIHNVTIAGTDVNADVRPGQSFRTPPLGRFLEAGETYTVICRFHGSQGMTGEFTVAE